MNMTNMTMHDHHGSDKTVLWSEASEWLGQDPVAGEDVTIPAGLTVVLDRSTPELGNLIVSGKLIFDEQNISLTADNIVVFGEMRAGSEGKRHTHKAEIVLTGKSGDDDIVLADLVGSDHFGSGHSAGGHHASHMSGHMTKPINNKAIIVAPGGKLSLHGAKVNSWTQIGATAEAGDTSITLEGAPTGWNVGDAIVIAPTDTDVYEVEERTITSVEGSTVSFDKPLAYQHYGKQQDLGNGKFLDMRAEVTNLSRNISITGTDEGETRIDRDEDNSSQLARSGYGGHTVYMTDSKVELDGVEFNGLGLSGKLGGYPIHFHHAGDAKDSYIKNSSIHHTFQRGLVVHKTDNLLVEGNTIFDTMSHSYFLEDGDEIGNRFIDNLAMLPRTTQSKFRIDNPNHDSRKFERASAFWITNPANSFKGNHAVGVPRGQGFWFVEADNASRTAINEKKDPRAKLPLAQFEDNTAHTIMFPQGSPGNIRYRFDWTGNALEFDDTVISSNSDNAAIKNFTAWKIGNIAIQIGPTRTLEIQDPILAEARVMVQSASRGRRPGDRPLQLINPTIVAETQNTRADKPFESIFPNKLPRLLVHESARPLEFINATIIGEDDLNYSRRSEHRNKLTLKGETQSDPVDSGEDLVTTPTHPVVLEPLPEQPDSEQEPTLPPTQPSLEDPTVSTKGLLTLALVNPKTDKIVEGYEDLSAVTEISLSKLDLEEYNLVAKVNADSAAASAIKSIKFESNVGDRIENVSPYALFGDTSGDFSGRALRAGDFTIKATAYSGERGTGEALYTVSSSYTVTDRPVESQHVQPIDKSNSLDDIARSIAVGLNDIGSATSAAVLSPAKASIKGNKNDNVLVGGVQNQRISGGGGADTLSGVDDSQMKPGLGEKDVLIGGKGADLYILGNAATAFYDDGDSTTEGLSDYAEIRGLAPLKDTIQLSGNKENYQLGSSSIGRDRDLAILLKSSGKEELIGMIRGGQSRALTLDDAVFKFV